MPVTHGVTGSSPVRTASLQSKIRKSSDSQQNQGFFRFRAEAEYSVSMVEEFDLLEEVEVQFCDEECTESVWCGMKYSESLFCREKPKSELTVVIKEEGMMYFLTADIKEFAGLCRKHGWYIVSHQRFNEAMEIGMCLMEAGRHAGWYSLGRSKEWNTMIRDVLNFTFEREKKMDFYPYETMFKGEVLIDGCRCHYLHDYYPTRIKKTNAHQKRVSNLIFRFKEGGHCGELVARILALYLKHAGFNGTKEDMVLIPIPASTMERQRKRFPVVCYYLSKWMGIADGFKAIWIEEDREQLKGKGKDKDILQNLQFTRRYINGKNVVLLDDVLTTGESFRQLKQLKRKMEQLGALSVVGVFLGKTV